MQTDGLLADVAQSVFDVWAATADPDELTRLLANHPNVPPSINRILTTDLVTRSGRSEIPTWARFSLREEFWKATAH